MKVDVLIVGAGFAGAATAFHLSRRFDGAILLVDKEEVPGFHASGRNASLLLQATENPVIRKALVASRRFYEEHRPQVGFESHGSLLLGPAEELEACRDPGLFPSEYWTPEQVLQRIPLLEGHRIDCALFTPSDGVVDIAALLQFYLREAQARGVRLLLRCEVNAIAGSGPYEISTSQGLIEADFLLNAAGAWAGLLGEMAGASRPPLSAYKRHLFVLDEIGQVDLGWPFVWDIRENFYFRPESGGLLFSVCDEELSTTLEPTVSPDISETLAGLIWSELPALRGAMQRKVWSCFRTRLPDQPFLIGWDPVSPHFFWIAGLGGHGMGASWEIGRLAAEAFLAGPAGPVTGPEAGRGAGGP